MCHSKERFIMRKYISILFTGIACCMVLSCNKLLSEQVPQGTLSDEQVKTPANAEAMVVSAYAIFTTAEDINSSFSMWNFDVRSDDAYKGGNGTSDGDVFHQLEGESALKSRVVHRSHHGHLVPHFAQRL